MKILAALALSLVLATAASAQLVTEKGSKSDQTIVKIHKLDLLIKILPLALKKEQYDDLLLAIEKARAEQKKLLSKEDDTLESLDPKISEALDAALTKTTYPPRELQTEIAGKTGSASINRALLSAQLVEQIYNVALKSLNAGQIKAMAGSFEDKYIDPTVKKGDLKDDLKVKFFIQAVFMDPATYDLLVTLDKTAAAAAAKG